MYAVASGTSGRTKVMDDRRMQPFSSPYVTKCYWNWQCFTFVERDNVWIQDALGKHSCLWLSLVILPTVGILVHQRRLTLC